MKNNSFNKPLNVIDILVLILKKKKKILLITIALFILISVIAIYKKRSELTGTITIFPSNKIEIINDLNTYTKLEEEKK